jgi:hypothetical protein
MATTSSDVSNGVAAAGSGGVQKLWEHPDPESTHMWKFMQDVNKKHQLQLKTYDDLYKWSIEHIADFWGEVWKTTGVKASQPYNQVTRPTHVDGMQFLGNNSILKMNTRSSTSPLACSHAHHGSPVQDSTSQRICSSLRPSQPSSTARLRSLKRQKPLEQQ